MESQLTKVDLIAKIETAWTQMNDALEQLSEAQLLQLDPTTGWSVKDHLIHLALWEQGIVALLQRQPRWAAMGVDEAAVAATDMDGLNDILVAQNKQRPLAEVLAAFRQAHQQMLAVLTDMSEADLYRSHADYIPGGREDPIIGWVMGNTFEHYEEHQAWIEAMMG
jgi:hypothetical protein